MEKHPLELFHYCPRCGSPRFEVNNEKSKRCDACGFVLYFNPIAATVALICNERGELLVARRANEPAKGTLDLPGGFLDCHETGEEGVAREVKEETGFTVVEARYLFSLPNTYLYSGFLEHTLDQFFVCRVASTDAPCAQDDVAQLTWMPLDKIVPNDFGLSSISRGVARFVEMMNSTNSKTQEL